MRNKQLASKKEFSLGEIYLHNKPACYRVKIPGKCFDQQLCLIREFHLGAIYSQVVVIWHYPQQNKPTHYSL
jgi:hypothetical protein